MPDDNVHHEIGQIPTNLRLVRLVEVVAQSGVPMSPAALSDALGLPKPTMHRLLNTAEAEELLQRHIDGKSFGPGRRLRRIATNTLSSERMRTDRMAILRAVASDVGETCNIAVPNREGMIYLERVETHWPLRIQLPIGTQVPFHCTASGKMYLSALRRDKLDRTLKALPLTRHTKRSLVRVKELSEELQNTSERSYATDNEEFMDGMAAIAVPILDDQNRLLSTLSIHAPIQRHDISSLVQYLKRLREAADELAALAVD